MKPTKFLELLVFEKKLSIGWMLNQGEGRNGMNWSTYQKLAALTKYVDYGCKFTELGCRAYRFKSKKQRDEQNADWKKNHKGISHPSIMCCCGGCCYAVGYQRSFYIESVAKIARYYNNKTGFWREGKGCILPRKYRSFTCLSYSCGGEKSFATRLLLRTMKMSESQLYRYFEKNYPKHKHRNIHSWSIAGIVKFFKSEFEKEKEERRKK